MLVIDASALYEMVTGGTKADAVRKHMLADGDPVAPQLVDVEVLGVIRRDLFRGVLDNSAANQAVADLRNWPGERIGHAALIARAWELRNTVRISDGFYVALAEALDATLLTLDRRLKKAPGIRCKITVP